MIIANLKGLLVWVKNLSEEEKKPKRRRFKSRIECFVSFDVGKALEFRRLMEWAIDALKGDVYYSSTDGELPVFLHENAFQVSGLDGDRIRMVNIRICRPDIDFSLDSKANRRFSFPAKLYLPCKQFRYALEAIDKDSTLNMLFSLQYNTTVTRKVADFRNPEFCPECGRPTIYNQLPPEKRGKRHDRYKCVCGWKGKVKTKRRKAKFYESSLVVEKSKVEVEVEGKGKEKFEIVPFSFDLDEHQFTMPKIFFTGQVKVARVEFLKKLKRINKLTNTATFVLNSDGLKALVREDYVRSASFEFSDDIILNHRGKAKAGYNVRLLLKSFPPTGMVASLQFADNMPMLIIAESDQFTASQIEVWQAPILID